MDKGTDQTRLQEKVLEQKMNLVWDMLTARAVSGMHVELTVNPRVGLRSQRSLRKRLMAD